LAAVISCRPHVTTTPKAFAAANNWATDEHELHHMV
jgi:hypothetical protein